MLPSVVSVLVVAQSSSEVPEGLMNNPVHFYMLVQSPVHFGAVSVVFDEKILINSSVCPDGDEVRENLVQYIRRDIFIQVTKEIFF